MAKHILHRLTDAQIKKTKKPGRLADGGGLYLSIKEDGSKSFLFVWTRESKRRTLGMGRYQSHPNDYGVSLADVRKLAQECRMLLKDGLDPKAERERLRRKAEQEELERSGKLTFKQVATDYIKIHEKTWSNPKHRQQWTNTLLGSDGMSYTAPLLPMRIDEITRKHILEVLQPIWLTKPETASRIRGRLERVFDYAQEEGLMDGKNPAQMRGNLLNALPKQSTFVKVRHHTALPYRDIPVFIERLKQSEAMSALALEFIILTGARSSECTKAQWSEFDLENAIWTVPANRMKNRKEHEVPLSGRAMEILEELKLIRLNDFVFFGQKPNKPISNGALDNLLERMQVNVTTHGFRSSLRDWAGNETTFSREVAELALSHTIGDATERAYRRETALDKRRELMEAWAGYCQGEDTAKIVSIRGVVGNG